MRSLPMLGLGIFFALAGLGLFAMTLRKSSATNSTAPLKGPALREQQARQTEANKLRIAAVLAVAVGAVLMVLSS